MTKKRKHKMFVNVPDGVKTRRHTLANGRTAITIPAQGFDKLVALMTDTKVLWIHSECSLTSS